MIPVNKIKLLPKQKVLKNLIQGNTASWIGYGGARGGAKSYAVRELALFFGFHKKYKLKSLIFRRFSKELLNNHILPLYNSHPKVMTLFNKSEKILYDEQKNPVISFGYADSESDIYTFQGMEYDLIFIDEATQCTENQINFLRTTNRTTKSGFKPKMILTMNPGGVSHAFIKRIFVDKIFRGNENSTDYKFIYSHLWDNVYWVLQKLAEHGYTVDDYYKKWNEEQRRNFCLSYSDYASKLAGLPHELKLAYLYGDWNIFGGSFFKGFDPSKQIIAPFLIPKEWKLTASIDPGFSSPCSFGLTARDFEGNYYRIYTYYEKEKSSPEHRNAIVSLLKDPKSVVNKLTGGKMPDIFVAGRDAFAKKDRYAIISSEKTFADLFADDGFYLIPAFTDRKQGWWAWKSLFSDTLAEPKYFIFSGFNNSLIDEINSAVSDNKEPEDLSGKGNDPSVSDHALDEQRYGLMALFKPVKYDVKSKTTFRNLEEDSGVWL